MDNLKLQRGVITGSADHKYNGHYVGFHILINICSIATKAVEKKVLTRHLEVINELLSRRYLVFDVGGKMNICTGGACWRLGPRSGESRHFLNGCYRDIDEINGSASPYTPRCFSGAQLPRP
jgi:hypothetical protein